MGLNSDITLNIDANLEALNKSIKAINKSMKFDLGVNIHNALKNATKGLREGLAKNAPTYEIQKLKDKIKEATMVELRFKLDQASKDLINIGAQITGTYATIKGLIGSPVSASLDFNTAINEINKFSHFSEQELAKFKKDMFSLGKSNGLDLNNILKIGELSAQLGVGKNELKDFTQNAINLKIGLGISQEEAVNYSSKISKAFHLNIKDLQVFSDEVAAMATSTKTSAKAILEVTKTTLAGAKAFGLSAKEASALSASFLSVGLDSSEASSSINKFFTELNNIDNATPAFHQALAKMGIDAEQLKEDIQSNPQVAIQNLFEDLNDLDDEERFGVISELFGKKMANNINSAKDGVKAFNLALEASKDSSGALQKAVDEAAGDGFGDSIIELKAAWSEFKVEFGNIFIPTLKWVFDITRNILGGLTDFLHNNGWAKNLIGFSVGILAFVKSAGLLIFSFKTLNTLIFYPVQLFARLFSITNVGIKVIPKLSYAIKFLRVNYKLAYRSIRSFNYGLFIKNTYLKISTFLTKAYTLSVKAMGWALNTSWSGIKKVTYAIQGMVKGVWRAILAVVTFNYKLAFKNTILKISTALTYAYRGALFALNTGFKIASFGVSLFSKIFKVSMWSIKGALISTGIGALIVGLGIAVEYVVTNWSSVLPKLVGLWEWVKEKFSGIIDFFKNAFDWLGKAIDNMLSSVSGITDFLGLTDSKSIDINASKTSSFSLQGSLDETLARQNENKAKMLSQIQSSQTDNSRQIHDYKQITINTTGNAQEIARAINTYSYDDDDNL